MQRQEQCTTIIPTENLFLEKQQTPGLAPILQIWEPEVFI